MFCYKCGNQIPDESQFCFKCGTALNATATTGTNNASPESKEIDREAIKIYLSNVLALECVISKLQNDWCEVDNSIKAFEATNYNKQFLCYDNRYAWFRYDGSEYYVWLSTDRYNKYYLNFGKDVINYSGAWCPFSLNMDYLNADTTWPGKDCPMNLAIELFFGIFIDPFYKKAVKRNFFELYEQFKATAPQQHKENAKKIQPEVNKRSGISDEIDKAKELLKKAYDINLIPQQFRNIYAVWFIYDYIATSNETLSAAFLHCDLDKIKQKLDTIIEQQKEIIINQRILMAQNAQMIEQNNQTLNRLASIELNTERAAQYAEIASNNAEACAWIGLANYINK